MYVTYVCHVCVCRRLQTRCLECWRGSCLFLWLLQRSEVLTVEFSRQQGGTPLCFKYLLILYLTRSNVTDDLNEAITL